MDRIMRNFVDLGDTSGSGDDFPDKMNRRYTVFVLSAFSLVLLTRQYVGVPINCWCPAHFTEEQCDFTETVCWTTDTYYLPYEQQDIPREDEPHEMIGYYQWVPLILAAQAILFYLPRPIWMMLNKKSGVAVSTITDAAIECQRTNVPEEREKILTYMTRHMGRFLMHAMSSRLQAGCCASLCWSLYGRYLVFCYLFVKLLYMANALGQLFLLDRFLGIDEYHKYGLYVMERMFSGQDWTTSDRFPRVTLCDIKVRQLGNIHRYTIQCSLPMNLFNEIIFIFIWFWIVFVVAITFLSLVRWAFISFATWRQIKYVQSRLTTMSNFQDIIEEDTEINKEEVEEFVHQFLRADGCLLVRLVSQNTSDIIAAEFLYKLWIYYQKRHNKIENIYKEGKLQAGHEVSEESLNKEDTSLMSNSLTHRVNATSHKQEPV